MTKDMRTILAAAFLLLPWQTLALECGPMPEEVSKSMLNCTDEFLANWWWKCLGEQSQTSEAGTQGQIPT